MKILFITYPMAFHTPGGGEIQLMAYKKQLELLGHQVDLFNPWKPDFENYDLVHYFSVVGGSIHICNFIKSLKIPLVISSSLWITDETKHLYPLEEIKGQLSLADVIIGNSNIECDNMSNVLNIPRNRFKTVYNGVDDTFYDKVNPNIFREYFNLHDKFVLNIGNIEPRKNQLNLVKAMKSFPNIKLVLIGHIRDGDYANQVMAEGGKQVQYLGYLENDDQLLRSAFNACEVFCLPSTLETPGLAALEALACNSKVIVTSVGATYEYFRDSVLYCQPMSVNSIVDAIEASLKNNKSSINTSNFLWGNVVSKLSNVYKSTMSKDIDAKSFLQNLKEGFCGFIENQSEDESKLTLTGWAADFANNEEMESFYLFVNDNCVEIDFFRIERKDVTQNFSSLNSNVDYGYQIEVDIEDTVVETLKLFAQSRDGVVHEVNPLEGGKALQMELIGKCNLRCPACPSVNQTGFHGFEMTEEEIDSFKPMMLKANSMCFDGFGEILLSKKLKYALDSVPVTQNLVFHTNGMLLHEYKELLVKYGLPIRKIIVSMDSLKPEKYEKLRRGGNLQQVLRNIREFVSYRNSLGLKYPKIIPNMMVLSSTYTEMGAFVELAKELDNTVEFIHLFDANRLDDVDKKNFTYQEEKIINVYNEFLEEKSKVEASALEKNVEVYWNGSILKVDEQTTTKYIGEEKTLSSCPYINNSACVQADGKYMFCVWQTSPIFNWKKYDGNGLTNPRVLKVRDMLKNNKIPFECSGSGCAYVRKRNTEETNPYGDNLLGRGGWQA